MLPLGKGNYYRASHILPEMAVWGTLERRVWLARWTLICAVFLQCVYSVFTRVSIVELSTGVASGSGPMVDPPAAADEPPDDDPSLYSLH